MMERIRYTCSYHSGHIHYSTLLQNRKRIANFHEFFDPIKVFMKSFIPACRLTCSLGWFKNPVSSQTEKLMAATRFSDYLGLNHYKKAKKVKHFVHLGLAQRPQSFVTYR